MLYFVSPEIGPSLDAWVNLIISVIKGGAEIIQVRDKTADAQALTTASLRIIPYIRKANARLIINDRVDVAYGLQADGVHLGQTDLSPQVAREILGPKAIIGWSVDNLEQLEHSEMAYIDYLAASPVFETQSKMGCAPPWGLDGLRQLCAATALPVIGIGGIKTDNIDDVLKCGAAGVAVISAIANTSDPKKATEQLRLQCLNGMKKHSFTT